MDRKQHGRCQGTRVWLRGNPRARVLALGPMTLRVRADVRVRLRALCAVYARHISASERMRARHTSASKCVRVNTEMRMEKFAEGLENVRESRLLAEF